MHEDLGERLEEIFHELSKIVLELDAENTASKIELQEQRDEMSRLQYGVEGLAGDTRSLRTNF